MADGDDDGATIIAKQTEVNPDKTLASRKRRADTDDTVIVGGGTAEDTMLTDTVASLSQGRDRTRKVERGAGRRSSASTAARGLPGVLAEGRVASKPGKHV